MSAKPHTSDLERALVEAAIVRLRASIVSLVMGVAGAVGLFAATAWLVARGGEDVGAHLGLLAHYFPGYAVTWPGAFIGAGYGFVVGAVVGWLAAWVYNRVAARAGAA